METGKATFCRRAVQWRIRLFFAGQVHFVLYWTFADRWTWRIEVRFPILTAAELQQRLSCNVYIPYCMLRSVMLLFCLNGSLEWHWNKGCIRCSVGLFPLLVLTHCSTWREKCDKKLTLIGFPCLYYFKLVFRIFLQKNMYYHLPNRSESAVEN